MKIELQNVNTCKLHDELIASGIMPNLVESLDNTTWVTVDDNQESAVMAIVAVHNITPVPQQPTELELLKTQVTDFENQILILMGV